MNEAKLKEHVSRGGDFQDAVILSHLSNSMADFFITADEDLRKQADWDDERLEQLDELIPHFAEQAVYEWLETVDQWPDTILNKLDEALLP